MGLHQWKRFGLAAFSLALSAAVCGLSLIHIFRFRPDGKIFSIGVVASVFYGRQMALLAELNLPD